MIYFLLFLLLLFLSYHFDFKEHYTNKYTFYYILLIIFICLAGFRYRLGVDTIRYERYFQDIQPLYLLSITDFEKSSFDPLYLLLASLSKTISSDFWVLQFLQASLVNTIFFSFIKKNTTKIYFALLIYYTFLYMSFMCEVMREACAVSMFLLSWNYFKNNKWLGYYFYCFLAFLFHVSAILLIFLPFLKFLRITKLMKINKYSIVIFILTLFIGIVIQHHFFDYIQFLSVIENIEDKINNYSDDDLAGSTLNIFGISITLFRYVLYPYFTMLFLKYNTLSENVIKMEPMIFLCLIFAILTIPITLFYRYNNYFMPFVIIILSELIYSKSVVLSNKYFIRTSYKFWFVIMFPFFFMQIYGYLNSIGNTEYKEYMRYYPYVSIFNKSYDKNREAVFNYFNAY